MRNITWCSNDAKKCDVTAGVLKNPTTLAELAFWGGHSRICAMVTPSRGNGVGYDEHETNTLDFGRALADGVLRVG